MMKNTKKYLATALAFTVGLVLCGAMTACSALTEVTDGIKSAIFGEQEEEKSSDDKAEQSSLIGTFTYNEAIGQQAWTLQMTRDLEKQDTDTVKYVYCTVYPQTIAEGSPVCFTIDQRLKLSRDYTYRYQYTILLSNPQDWGAQFARFVVDISGTYTYNENGEDTYSVTLSAPLSGTETIYGSTLSRTDIYGWSMHSSADYVLDIETARAADENFIPDKHIAGRVVTVEKSQEGNSVSDDIFYRDLMNTLALYSDYSF